MGILQKFVGKQVAWSRMIERSLPAYCVVDGNRQFQEQLVPAHLRSGLVIYDVGGGKQPYLSPAQKRTLNARVIGIDIDPDELARAPEGAYDEAITADIAATRGRGDADLVICQAMLEHVRDTDGAIGSIASILRPGGEALIFVPCRNALFARLNLLLPERVKRGLLFRLYPRMAHAQGFPSFYRNCTPAALSGLARKHGLEVAEVRTYWKSEYFYAFFPAYLAWRSWLLLARAFGRENACETFTMTLRKPDVAPQPSLGRRQEMLVANRPRHEVVAAR